MSYLPRNYGLSFAPPLPPPPPLTASGNNVFPPPYSSVRWSVPSIPPPPLPPPRLSTGIPTSFPTPFGAGSHPSHVFTTPPASFYYPSTLLGNLATTNLFSSRAPTSAVLYPGARTRSKSAPSSGNRGEELDWATQQLSQTGGTSYPPYGIQPLTPTTTPTTPTSTTITTTISQGNPSSTSTMPVTTTTPTTSSATSTMPALTTSGQIASTGFSSSVCFDQSRCSRVLSLPHAIQMERMTTISYPPSAAAPSMGYGLSPSYTRTRTLLPTTGYPSSMVLSSSGYHLPPPAKYLIYPTQTPLGTQLLPTPVGVGVGVGVGVPVSSMLNGTVVTTASSSTTTTCTATTTTTTPKVYSEEDLMSSKLSIASCIPSPAGKLGEPLSRPSERNILANNPVELTTEDTKRIQQENWHLREAVLLLRTQMKQVQDDLSKMKSELKGTTVGGDKVALTYKPSSNLAASSSNSVLSDSSLTFESTGQRMGQVLTRTGGAVPPGTVVGTMTAAAAAAPTTSSTSSTNGVSSGPQRRLELGGDTETSAFTRVNKSLPSCFMTPNANIASPSPSSPPSTTYKRYFN